VINLTSCVQHKDDDDYCNVDDDDGDDDNDEDVQHNSTVYALYLTTNLFSGFSSSARYISTAILKMVCVFSDASSNKTRSHIGCNYKLRL
jgi:hypothetical protein